MKQKELPGLKVDKLSITAGAAKREFDIYYVSGKRNPLVAVASENGEKVAYATSLNGLEKSLRRKINVLSPPRKTEKIILVRCGGPVVLEVEVVSHKSRKRRVKQDNGTWSEGRNPRNLSTFRKTCTVYEMPYAPARLVKAQMFGAIVDALESTMYVNRDFSEHVYNQVKRRKSFGTEIDPAKVDKIDLKKVAKKFFDAETKKARSAFDKVLAKKWKT